MAKKEKPSWWNSFIKRNSKKTSDKLSEEDRKSEEEDEKNLFKEDGNLFKDESDEFNNGGFDPEY